MIVFNPLFTPLFYVVSIRLACNRSFCFLLPELAFCFKHCFDCSTAKQSSISPITHASSLPPPSPPPTHTHPETPALCEYHYVNIEGISSSVVLSEHFSECVSYFALPGLLDMCDRVEPTIKLRQRNSGTENYTFDSL